ncbi:hypothetical protein CMN23_02260 [Candidatus Saccharibacteria bacterium]|nr:hypothetical protein [Candidatus Saccharibacteria bacterium]MBJ58902.1 hypothetical protein [Candidatus Saccharibacteria bacterium]HBO64823.1 hypothetical protein [Candidatus Saccharibacteria bacterium]
MKPLQIKDAKWILCLLLSIAITYISIQVAGDRGYSGQPVLVWFHALLFLLSIALVIAAIVLKSKQQ